LRITEHMAFSNKFRIEPSWEMELDLTDIPWMDSLNFMLLALNRLGLQVLLKRHE